MKAQKLIQEYENKVLLMDTVIEKNTKAIRSLRKQKLATNDYLHQTSTFVDDRRIAEAKRQSYIQFIVDLKTLEDE